MIAMPDPSTNNPSAALVAHMMWSGSLFALCRSAKKKNAKSFVVLFLAFVLPTKLYWTGLLS